MSLFRRLPAFVTLSAVLALAPSAHASTGFQGLWCGNGLLKDYSIRLTPGENLDEVDGVVMRRNRSWETHGTVEGSTIRTQSTKIGSLVLRHLQSELKIIDGDGPVALLRGFTFRRAEGAGCS